jgi:two-component system, NarL family, sensor histidine kinase DesK
VLDLAQSGTIPTVWRLFGDPGYELRTVTRPRARIGVVIGLLFLGGPLADLFGGSFGTGRLAALLLGTAVFVVAYVLLMPPTPWLTRRGPTAVMVVLASMPVLAVALLAGGAPRSYAALFVYFAAAVGMLLPATAATAIIGVTAVGVGIGGAVYGANGGSVAATVLTIVAIGLMMTAFGRIARTNRELQQTREELARLAVSEERLRIARDLHDLLGHSLSVISLKSELAHRLVQHEPERAAAELRDIQAVTRDALAGVREAVRGYRRPSLAQELEGAQAALRAAGIDCELGESGVELPADVEAVFAWAVREGATNVIRHSGAHRCAIRVDADRDRAAVEIDDDGTGSAVGAEPGSGLSGLRERAQRLRGELEAGARPGGGYRLRLSVPLAPA